MHCQVTLCQAAAGLANRPWSVELLLLAGAAQPNRMLLQARTIWHSTPGKEPSRWSTGLPQADTAQQQGKNCGAAAVEAA
jgi:hypothetical protein